MGKQTPSSAMAIHKDSHTISKVKNHHQQPKIRIIHIFSPEIIKTDVSNFRELVQRLTGKHAYDAGDDDTQNEKQLDTNQEQMKKIPSPSLTLDPSKTTPTKSRRNRASSNFDDDDDDDEEEVEVGNVYNEQMVWKMKREDDHHGGGFGILETFFGKMEDFKYKIDDEEEQLDEFSSLLPIDASAHMHAFEAAQLA